MEEEHSQKCSFLTLVSILIALIIHTDYAYKLLKFSANCFTKYSLIFCKIQKSCIKKNSVYQKKKMNKNEKILREMDKSDRFSSTFPKADNFCFSVHKATSIKGSTFF